MAEIVLRATVTADRRLVFELPLPPEVPVGEVEVVVRPAMTAKAPPADEDEDMEAILHLLNDPEYGKTPATVAEILASPMVGMWANREDIGDSAEYVERLRREEEERRNPWKRQE